MSCLTHGEILKLIREGKLRIEPLSDDTVRENGIDLRIGNEYAIIRQDIPHLDLVEMSDEEIAGCYRIVKNVDKIVVPPRGFVLLTTMEYVKFPDNVIGLCNLRSTLARAGLSIPPTVIDCGFEGEVTIELVNNGPVPVVLYPGMRFLHVILIRCVGEYKYLGKYLGQRGVKPPKSLRSELVRS